jgi:hypothetical protein
MSPLQARMPQFYSLRPEVQVLVKAAVTDAIDFVNDMSAEGSEVLTISNLKDQAQIMMRIILDPELSNIELPKTMIDAINEFVEEKIGFAIVYNG